MNRSDTAGFISGSELNQDVTKLATKAELRSTQAYLVRKTDFDNKLSSFNKMINSNKTKHILVKNEFKKAQTFGSSLFIAPSWFSNYRAQLFIIFQPIPRTITIFFGLGDTISQWKPKGLSDKKFIPPYTTSKRLSQKLVWNNSEIKLKFKESCLKQDKATSTRKIYHSLWIRCIVRRFKHWFYFKKLFAWICKAN